MSKILIFIAKIIGRFWVFACIPFRGYARNYVYNCSLQGKLPPIKRLQERFPTKIEGGWDLKDIHLIKRTNDAEIRGFIKYRKVNKFTGYLIVFFIWGWNDDDANEDLTDIGYINTVKVGGSGYRTGGKDRSKDKLFWYRRWLPEFKEGDVFYGNAFDLGDVRAEFSFLKTKFKWYQKLFSIYSWIARNTAMNFQYLLTNY